VFLAYPHTSLACKARHLLIGKRINRLWYIQIMGWNINHDLKKKEMSYQVMQRCRGTLIDTAR
jgi:hypothetical protein